MLVLLMVRLELLAALLTMGAEIDTPLVVVKLKTSSFSTPIPTVPVLAEEIVSKAVWMPRMPFRVYLFAPKLRVHAAVLLTIKA